jgi:hypothetical protein
MLGMNLSRKEVVLKDLVFPLDNTGAFQFGGDL